MDKMLKELKRKADLLIISQRKQNKNNDNKKENSNKDNSDNNINKVDIYNNFQVPPIMTNKNLQKKILLIKKIYLKHKKLYQLKLMLKYRIL